MKSPKPEPRTKSHSAPGISRGSGALPTSSTTRATSPLQLPGRSPIAISSAPRGRDFSRAIAQRRYHAVSFAAAPWGIDPTALGEDRVSGERRHSAGPLPASAAGRRSALVPRLLRCVLVRAEGQRGPAERRDVAANAGFRRYVGLRSAVALPVATSAAIEARFVADQSAGLVRFGLSRQDAAVVTCITPSVLRGDHVDFVDGPGEGYASAAIRLKAGRPWPRVTFLSWQGWTTRC